MQTLVLTFKCKCGHSWTEEFLVSPGTVRIDFAPPPCPKCGNKDHKQIQQHSIWDTTQTPAGNG